MLDEENPRAGDQDANLDYNCGSMGLFRRKKQIHASWNLMYREIKLTYYTVKIWMRIRERRLMFGEE